MKTLQLGLILAALLATPQAAAQNKVPTAPVQPAAATPVKVSNDGQWEYLVISFGKTYFSSPADIDAKKNGESKLMVFGPLGGVVAQEALSTQAQVDTLGRYGWELIGVLGAIGGDQQWVFKRRYDPDRAAQEAAQIKKEGADLAAARDKAAKEEASRPETPPPTELVELDSQEARAKQAQLDQALRSRLTSALNLPGWTSDINASSITAAADGTPAQSFGVGAAAVVLDLTQRALSGNTYRRSTVDALIAEYANALKTQGRFSEVREGIAYCDTGAAAVRISAAIKFNNELRTVSSYPKLYCMK